MSTGIRKKLAAAVTVACTTALVAVTAPGSSTAQAQVASLRAFAITSDGTRMATFTTDRPDILDWVRVVKGLVGDTALVGIDFRVQNGLMYGVGNQGGIYTIQTPPQTVDVVVTKVSQLTIPLYGTNFGVDFNPAANRLRVISDNGQNLRHNIDDKTAGASPAAGHTAEDSVLSTPGVENVSRGVTAAAYTNNDLNGETATTLFDLNTTTDQVVIQSPANNGTLAPTGKLGVDAGANAGFDIYSDLVNGKTVSATGFAAVTPPNSTLTTFYTVDVLTGTATAVATDDPRFPLPIGDVAVALDTSP
ncbi:DUF4394 domain-containing protein [Streptomyces sp. NRRL WC-3626]|uniref:DUF4394 domain-containing protein n=1 Tax=Streptomyces sp. NRRL WC-3626 TaxID=1463926 RepID=UPI0004C0C4EA|nr:DUF4394 domain-containing protein [Streptomyces sp. NRRL WC-3626]